jgi:hypothetical protein
MATSKKKLKDLKAHLFISVNKKDVTVIYHDDIDNGAVLGAAICTAMQKDAKLFDIMSAALLTFLDEKKKYNSKKSNTVHKKPVKKAK